MKYKIRKHSYMHYETQELTRYLNFESEQGYKFLKMFAGFWVFEKSDEHLRYMVDRRENTANKESDKYLDRYLVVRENQTVCTEKNKETEKARIHIITNCLLRIIVGLIVLVLEVCALKHEGPLIHFGSSILFYLSLLCYVNYFIFAFGEIADYIIERKEQHSKDNKRSRIKKNCFGLGMLLKYSVL